MRTVTIVLCLLCTFLLPTVVLAGDTDSMRVTSYDLTLQKVFICNGSPANSLALPVEVYYVGDPTPNGVTIDSVVFEGDPNVFFFPKKWENLTGAFYSLLKDAIIYHPTSIGDDTVNIIAYYKGKLCRGHIICHAIPAPGVSLSGSTYTQLSSFSGFFFVFRNNQEYILRYDDQFIGDPNAYPVGVYHASDTPKPKGFNPAVVIRSCAGVTIDSINPVGDFSSVHFTGGLPQTPITIKAGDSLIIPYTFIPKLSSDTTHYLSFKTSGGQELIWNFLFTIVPALSVNQPLPSRNFSTFPNPAKDVVRIRFSKPSAHPIQIALLDMNGKKISDMEIPSNSQSVNYDIATFESGAYLLQVTTEQGTEVRPILVIR